MKVSLLLLPLLHLLLLTAVDCDTIRIIGQRFKSVTLPCKYDHDTYGPLPVCWGLGPVPKHGCSDQILATDGAAMVQESKVYSRFELLGRLDLGDVSLTIHNVTEEDAGMYGCRVEIPGLFNDKKLNINLAVFTVHDCPNDVELVSVGQDVTLNCHYNRKVLGDTPMCWNKGQIPLLGCDSQLIATDGSEVVEKTQLSSRFQMLGRLDRGDVSLTIFNIQLGDAGRYGCRVRVRGPFNDQRHHVDVMVVEAPLQTIGPLRETGRLSCRSASTQR